MTAKVSVWSSRHLAYQGRRVLINSVLLSMHTYWANVFVLPKKLLMEMEEFTEPTCGQGSITVGNLVM